MPPSEQLVDELADAILDGTAIDWAAAESSAEGTAQPLLKQLRVLAAIGELHRSTRPAGRRSPTALRHARSPGLQMRVSIGVTSGLSSGSAVARSETFTGRGIRGSIARSR